MRRRAWSDKLLRSWMLEGIFRLSSGFSLITVWSRGWVIPHLTRVHLFELPFWWREKKRGITQKSLRQWLQDRDYLYSEDRRLRSE